MLIQAAKTEVVRDGESESKKSLEMKIQLLEEELELKEKEFEKKLRTMRQEQERIKERYESMGGKSEAAKQVTLLETELQRTKTHYQKRIREAEDKYKYGLGKNIPAPKSSRSQASEKGNAVKDSELNEIKEQNERLIKERNILAQKVVTLESQNNQRRQSIPGSSPQKDEIKNMFYQPEESSSPSPSKPPIPSSNSNLNPFNLDNSN